MTAIRTGTWIVVMLVCCCRAHAEGTVFESSLRRSIEYALLDTVERDGSLEDKVKLKEDLRLIGLDEVAGAKRWERKKNPRVAMFSNMALPGLGQLYNGRRIKVAIMVGMNTFYLSKAWIYYKRSVIRKNTRDEYPRNTSTWFYHNNWYVFYKDSARDYLWWWGAVWVIGALDAYIDAHLFDLRAYVPESGTGQAKYLTLTMSF
jgi:hypothetical protein